MRCDVDVICQMTQMLMVQCAIYNTDVSVTVAYCIRAEYNVVRHKSYRIVNQCVFNVDRCYERRTVSNECARQVYGVERTM